MDSQFGFRANHSTSHAIHHSVDFIKSCHSRSMNVLGVFIDLSKAFDTIDHKILLNKLHNYGIRGSPYDLLKSYLSDRYQQVKIENHTLKNYLLSLAYLKAVSWERFYLFCILTIFKEYA